MAKAKTYVYRIKKDSEVCSDLVDFLYASQSAGLMNRPAFRYDQSYCWMVFTTDQRTWNAFMDIADREA